MTVRNLTSQGKAVNQVIDDISGYVLCDGSTPPGASPSDRQQIHIQYWPFFPLSRLR